MSDRRDPMRIYPTEEVSSKFFRGGLAEFIAMDHTTPRPPLPPKVIAVFNLRLAQDHPPSTESEMAQLFRHSIKNELNALGLGARCLLQDHELGKTRLSDEGRAFLRTIEPLVERLVSVVDQVRRLPVQSLEPHVPAQEAGA